MSQSMQKELFKRRMLPGCPEELEQQRICGQHWPCRADYYVFHSSCELQKIQMFYLFFMKGKEG